MNNDKGAYKIFNNLKKRKRKNGKKILHLNAHLLLKKINQIKLF